VNLPVRISSWHSWLILAADHMFIIKLHSRSLKVNHQSRTRQTDRQARIHDARITWIHVVTDRKLADIGNKRLELHCGDCLAMLSVSATLGSDTLSVAQNDDMQRIDEPGSH